VLNGTKSWITNAGLSEYYTVMAVTDFHTSPKEISGFVVEKGDAGVSFGPLENKMGIKGSPTRQVILNDVRLPADRMIGPRGAGLATALTALGHTRVTIAAQALGIAQGAFEQALAYAKERRQFDRPIAQFQAVQFMLADMAMKIEAARRLTYHAAAKSDRAMAGEKVDDLMFTSSAAKCFASDMAMEVTVDAVQLLGGNGYTCDYPVERMMRDAKVTQIYEGTNQIQRVVMSRHILTQ
jgi:alkylation response protein AidB-like acyl-CoA dehydrogenase